MSDLRNINPEVGDNYLGQQVPFDNVSGMSGQWVMGPVRVDITTGDITNDLGNGFITGFDVSGLSGTSGFSGEGFSGPSGPSGVSGFSGTGGTGNVFIAIKRCWMRI